MVQQLVHWRGVGILLVLLLVSLSACQSPSAATNTALPVDVQAIISQPSSSLTPTIQPTRVVVPTSESVMRSIPLTNQVQLKKTLPNLLQLPASAIESINPNPYGLLANPVSLPTRSAQPITEGSLPQLELLQTIGLGEIGGGDFAPNNQFLVLETSLGFGVYELPSLQQRYFVQTENHIFNVRVSSDNTTIEVLYHLSDWSLERYNATTGRLIDRQPTSDTTHKTWDAQPILYDQATPRIISPNGEIEARFAASRTTLEGRQVSLFRLADQQPIFSGSGFYVRFSADSSYGLLIDWQVLVVVNLADGSSQSLSFPSYQKVTFSPDSQLLALDRGQQILNLEQTKIAYELPIQFELLEPRNWPRLDFTSDSTQINLGTSQWNLSSLSEIWQGSTEHAGFGKYRMITDADLQMVIETPLARQAELSVSQAGRWLYTLQLGAAHTLDMHIIKQHDQFIFLDEQNQISLVELSTGNPVLKTTLDYTAQALAISPDNQVVAVAIHPENPDNLCALLLDRASLQVRQAIQCHLSSNQQIPHAGDVAIQFSPDGQLLLLEPALMATNVVIYRVADGQALYQANNITISPDQRLIITIDRGQLQLWGIRA